MINLEEIKENRKFIRDCFPKIKSLIPLETQKEIIGILTTKILEKNFFSSILYDRKKLTLSINGYKILALSGGHGKGRLPQGKYYIGKTTEIIANKKNKPFTDKKNFSWWCSLYPLFRTKRRGLGIHPDGNIVGTSGCIGIIQEDSKEVFELLLKNKNNILIVK